MYEHPDSKPAFALAHLTDPHIACMDNIRASQLLNKRLLGYLRWKVHRRTEHSDVLLTALLEDLKQTRPDHIAVTGDLTHLSLPAEFQKARQWLQSLGPPFRVTVAPGNHDAYVHTRWDQSFACWTDYMRSDSHGLPDSPAASLDGIYPSLRIRGNIALIVTCTARPNSPLLAVGSLGEIQLQKLKILLSQTAQQRLFRIVLIHHPPTSGMVSWRKRLTDAAPLRSILASYGAELILHGHTHRIARSCLKTPAGQVPVMGAPSVSALGRSGQRRARYYIYRILSNTREWHVALTVRIYSPVDKRFIVEHQEHLSTICRVS